MNQWVSTAVLLVTMGCAATAALAEPPQRQRMNVFEGRVVDTAGRPVAGADVAIAHINEGALVIGDHIETTSALREKRFWFFTRRNTRSVGQTLTDEDGRWVFNSLRPGTYAIFVRAAGREVALIDRVVFETDVSLRDIVVHDPVRMTGSLVGFGDADDVFFEPEGSLPNISARHYAPLSADGSFLSPPLPNARAWSVNIVRPVAQRGYHATLFRTVRAVQPGTHECIDVDVTAAPQLSGTVVGPDGAGLADVAVRADSAAGSTYGTVTDCGGQYTLRLPPGAYRLTGTRHVASQMARCGAGPVDVAFARDITIPLRDSAQAHIEVDGFQLVRIGACAPQINTRTLSGEEFNLHALKGRVVLVHFWATECAPSLDTLRHIRSLHGLARNGDLVLVGVSVDRGRARVERFVRERLPWAQIFGGPLETNLIAEAYNVQGVPATFLVDHVGRLAARDLGREQLNTRVLKLLQTLRQERRATDKGTVALAD